MLMLMVGCLLGGLIGDYFASGVTLLRFEYLTD